MAQFYIDIKCVWEKSSGEFETFQITPREQMFNSVRVTSDDQLYEFVDDGMAVDKDTIPSVDQKVAKQAKHKKSAANKT